MIICPDWYMTKDSRYCKSSGFYSFPAKEYDSPCDGKKIFPEEVEFVREKSEIIKELCVLSVKILAGSNAGPEEVGTVVVPVDNLQNKSDNELQKLLENEVKTLSKDIAPYKQPSAIIIHREELPKTLTRKIKRKPMQEWCQCKVMMSV